MLATLGQSPTQKWVPQKAMVGIFGQYLSAVSKQARIDIADLRAL